MDEKERFSCFMCDRAFKNKKVLRGHMKRVHSVNLPEDIRFRKFKCPLCNNNIYFPNHEKFEHHVLETHKLKLQTHFFKFESQSQFLAWKETIEEQDVSFYMKGNRYCKKNIQQCIDDKLNPCVTQKPAFIRYKCHRSGFFYPEQKDNRKRRLKAQGSLKINAYCPSRIEAEFKKNGSVKVVFCSTHLGHKNEASHVRLSESVRKAIAAKIAANIPFDVILDEVRSTTGNNLTRKHILTKHDLFNIQQQYLKKDNFLPLDQLKDDVLMDTNSDGMQVQTYDPNVEDSESNDSNFVSFSVEDQNVWPGNKSNKIKEPDVTDILSCISSKESQLTSTDTQNVDDEPDIVIQNSYSLKNENYGPLFNENPEIELKVQLSITQMKNELIRKFCDKIYKLRSTRRIKWIQNHLEDMFDLSKKGRPIPKHFADKSVQVSQTLVPPRKNSSDISALTPPASQNINTKTSLPLDSAHLKMDTTSPIVTPRPAKSCHPPFKCLKLQMDNTKTCQKQVDNCVQTNPNESSSVLQNKHFLVPVLGSLSSSLNAIQSGKVQRQFLIVETKPNEPRPVPPLVAIPKPKLNKATDDHNYTNLQL